MKPEAEATWWRAQVMEHLDDVAVLRGAVLKICGPRAFDFNRDESLAHVLRLTAILATQDGEDYITSTIRKASIEVDAYNTRAADAYCEQEAKEAEAEAWRLKQRPWWRRLWDGIDSMR